MVVTTPDQRQTGLSSIWFFKTIWFELKPKYSSNNSFWHLSKRHRSDEEKIKFQLYILLKEGKFWCKSSASIGALNDSRPINELTDQHTDMSVHEEVKHPIYSGVMWYQINLVSFSKIHLFVKFFISSERRLVNKMIANPFHRISLPCLSWLFNDHCLDLIFNKVALQTS